MTKSQPRGLRNNNPLNIVKGCSWQGERSPQTDPVFEEFDTIEMGVRAAVLLIQTYVRKHKCRTVESIIRRWAPEAEANVQAYIRNVCRITSWPPNRVIDPASRHDVCFLLWAMAQVECGQVVPFHHFENAWALAHRR